MTDYEVVVGLEVHAELSTKTKIFCSCPTDFGAEPNTHTCPVCMAMPGALPVLNEKVVEYAVKAGLATNCTISLDSKGLPIGFQLIGKAFDEETIIRAAYTYEQNSNFRGEFKPTFK